MAQWTPDMKRTHKIVAPQMSPIHFELFEACIRARGYDLSIIRTVSREAKELGQQNINNNACYPAILTVGQLLHEVIARDGERIVPLITMTGGGCRASNYAALLEKALADNDLGDVPVIRQPLSPISGYPLNPLGFTLGDVAKVVYAAILGDIIMTLLHRVRPYEREQGQTDKVAAAVIQHTQQQLSRRFTFRDFASTARYIAKFFASIPLSTPLGSKPKIGIVGEILLKYHPDANNHLVAYIESSGCEAVVSPIIDFFLYCFSGPVFQHKLLARSGTNAALMRLAISLVETCKRTANRAITSHAAFRDIHWASIYDLSRLVSGIISTANSMGEGWLLPAEIIDLIHQDCHHIVVAQPFNCLPNHPIALGTINPIIERYADAEILPLNYDFSTPATNQENRLAGTIESALDSFGK